MRILFDQGTPVPLRTSLVGHSVATTFEMNWSTLENGELLARAETAGFEVFLTTDQNLCYQQNLRTRRIAVIILPTTRWPQIALHVAAVLEAIDQIRPGEYRELRW